MASKAENSANTRKKIIESALYLFSRNGVEQTPINTIMSHAKLTHGGFYHHFASKEALLAQVICDSVTLSKLSNPPAANVSLEKWLDSLLDSYLSLEHSIHESFACPLTFLAREVGLSSETVKRSYEVLLEGHIAKIQEHFCQHLCSEQSKAAATSATALMLGALTMAAAVDNSEQAQEILNSAKQTVKTLLLNKTL